MQIETEPSAIVEEIAAASREPMRIAMISTPFVSVPPAAYGGTELVVHELVEGLIDEGHDVTLFATGDSHTRAKLKWLYSKPKWPPNPYAEFDHVAWAMSEIAASKFNVIHAHAPTSLGIGRLLPNLPLVYTLHHPPEPELSDFYQQYPRANYVAISNRQKQLEVPLPHCEVIYHGLNPERFLCTRESEDYVCFVGRFSEVKGPHIAIDAAGRAGLPIRVGGEVHPRDIDFFERDLKWRLELPHVTYLGCVDVSQKVPLLQHAKALLAPIDWEEPFGLIMIEAMLSGCPVVAFPRGSVPELIDPGVTGVVVHSVAEMADTIRAGGLVERMDRFRCRAHAIERFGRSQLVSNHVRLYRKAIAEHHLQNGRMKSALSVAAYD